MGILIRGLATSPEAMSELRAGMLNAMAAYIGEQSPPEGADRWLDHLTDAAADEILADVALMVDGAMARQNGRAKLQARPEPTPIAIIADWEAGLEAVTRRAIGRLDRMLERGAIDPAQHARLVRPLGRFARQPVQPNGRAHLRLIGGGR